MNDTLALPTTRDEDWRYADAQALASADPALLTGWTQWAVAAGEVRRESRVIGLDDAAIERLRIHVGKGARLELAAVNAGGPYARLEAEVTLAEGAHFEFGGVTIGGDERVQEFVTRVIHAEPGASSNQTVRSVQWGRATGNFLGRIEVVRDAQKTDAAQNFRAILLERGATANAKPELEIFADDVKAAHGAAIGALDEAAAFYMASRGIAPDAARRLLVRAFIADAFVSVANEELREDLLEQALHYLEGAAL